MFIQLDRLRVHCSQNIKQIAFVHIITKYFSSRYFNSANYELKLINFLMEATKKSSSLKGTLAQHI